MTLLIMTLAAGFVGWHLPLRFGVAGFLGAALVLFLIMAGLRTASGFEGEDIQTSLLLFNGSWLSYIGFNVQVTYRAFVPVILILAGVLIWRATRRGAQADADPT